MKLKIEIDCGNAAFGPGNSAARNEEAAAILLRLAAKLKADGFYAAPEYVLRDTNGNRVGSAKFVGR